MSEHIRTIEVEGQKFEVDMREATKIEKYKVGSKIKLLLKTYSGYEVHPAVIVGIDAFNALPTIVIAYMANRWDDDSPIKFSYFNSESKDTEICPMVEDDIVPTREGILARFDKELKKKQDQIAELETKKEYFLRQYGTAFSTTPEEIAQGA